MVDPHFQGLSCIKVAKLLLICGHLSIFALLCNSIFDKKAVLLIFFLKRDVSYSRDTYLGFYGMCLICLLFGRDVMNYGIIEWFQL